MLPAASQEGIPLHPLLQGGHWSGLPAAIDAYLIRLSQKSDAGGRQSPQRSRDQISFRESNGGTSIREI